MSEQNLNSNPTFETHDGLSGAMIADGTYTREGSDLIITNSNDASVTIESYFSPLDQATLLSTDGARLTPDMVDSFLSHSNHYAQSTLTMNDIPPIAEATDVFGDVIVTRADGTKVSLESGMPIFQGDIVETTAEGAISITFADQTTFALSEDARLSIDEYVYNTAEQGGSSLFSMLKGSFVYTSGLIGKDDPSSVNIETPAGSIGIRGTVVMGKITPNGDGSEITIIDGAVIISNAGGTVELNDGFETAYFQSYQDSPQNIGQISADQMGETYGSLARVASQTFEQMGIPTSPLSGHNQDRATPDGQAPASDMQQPIPGEAPQPAETSGAENQNALPGQRAEGEDGVPPLTAEQQETLDQIMSEQGLTQSEALKILKQEAIDQNGFRSDDGQENLSPDGTENTSLLGEDSSSPPPSEGPAPSTTEGNDGNLFLADGSDGQVVFNTNDGVFSAYNTSDAFGQPIGSAPPPSGSTSISGDGSGGQTGDTGAVVSGPLVAVDADPLAITGLENLYGGPLREFMEPGENVARILTNASNLQFTILNFFDPADPDGDNTVEETAFGTTVGTPVSETFLGVNPFEIDNQGFVSTNNPLAFVQSFNPQIAMNIQIFNPDSGESVFTALVIDIQDMLNGGGRLIGNLSANTITGTAGLGDVIYGVDGNDILRGNGGADVLLGGLGDDQLEVTDNTFSFVSGDDGIDSLFLNAETNGGITVDFTVNTSRVKDIEKLEINSANSEEVNVTLDVASVIAMTDDDNILTIEPWDSDDDTYTSINLSGFTDMGRLAASDYQLYESSDGSAQILINLYGATESFAPANVLGV